MKDYNLYQTEDFLADEDFRIWAISEAHLRTGSKWSSVKEQNPGLSPAINQAEQIIRYAHDSAAALPQSLVNEQIARIMADARLHGKEEISNNVKPLYFWKNLISAASIAVFIAVSWLAYLQIHSTETATIYQLNVENKKDILIEEINQQADLKIITLPDKSEITLYPNSKLSYDRSFGSKQTREVYLEGKAFFHVQKDANHPFLVYANGMLTRVVGTSFEIETTYDGANVQVKTGKVAVTPVNNTKKQQLLLTSNQQANFSNKENIVLKSIVVQPLAIESTTTKPDFEFVNQPMPAVFDKLSQVYGLDIVYDKTMLKDCHVDVTLSNEPFFTKLDILCKTIGGSYENIDGKIIITANGCH